MDPTNEQMLQLKREIDEEIKYDNVLAVDHPERIRFQNLLDWLKEGGSKFSKVKMRYYSDNYRGVHASQNIKSGE